MASIGEVAVWSFELESWGECAQAATEADALAAFAVRAGVQDLRVAERISGRSQVFGPDLRPATDDQLHRTLAILAAQREETARLLTLTAPSLWAHPDDAVSQPTWMTWRTPADIAWHIADTESRGYPKRMGLPMRPRADDLRLELELSAKHTRSLLLSMPRDLITEYHNETWTAVKLLRRLAWHERVELVFLRRRVTALVRLDEGRGRV